MSYFSADIGNKVSLRSARTRKLEPCDKQTESATKREIMTVPTKKKRSKKNSIRFPAGKL